MDSSIANKGMAKWRTFQPSTWDDFLADIDRAREALAFEPREECFFRGHADKTWELLPTLFRYAKSAGLSADDTVGLESDLFWEFQARAQELQAQVLSDWDYL